MFESATDFAMSAADFAAYRSAVDEHAMVAITSRRGIIVYVNDHFCDVSGYSRQELVGVTHGRVNSGRHSHEFWRHLWQTIGAGRAWHGEICNSRHDRSEYWLESTILPLRCGEGILGYIAVSHLSSDLPQANEQRAAAWATVKSRYARMQATGGVARS